MTLTPAWRRRIDLWQNTLPKHFYLPLGSVKMGAFLTMDHLSYGQAVKKKFLPVKNGYAWGKKWEYGWFRGTIKLPKEAQGKKIVFKWNSGIESLVYVNGKARASQSKHRHPVLLTQSGKLNSKFEIVVESYAGHGPWVSHPGPVSPGQQSVPEPAVPQTALKESSFGVWEEDAYQLSLDIQALCEIRDKLEDNALRQATIDQALFDVTNIIDFELSYKEMIATFRKARKFLKPLMTCTNGTSIPTFHMVGHGHLDICWLWPLNQTYRKIAGTVANQLTILEQYPEHKYVQSQPHLLMMLKQSYPKIYNRFKTAVKNGSFIVDGGMWVEADTNITAGESLIRQFLLGKKFIKHEFGLESEVLWLPDVFGYSGSLPQIMESCRIHYFTTSKLNWNYETNIKFPVTTFWWEGIDGTKVLTHLHNNYNAKTSTGYLMDLWNRCPQKNTVSNLLQPFGHGDGGAGPDRDHLENIRRAKDLESCPKAVLGHPVDFFEKPEVRKSALKTYVGELYLEFHRGTYTSQAKTKKWNRKCEFALRESELWNTMASVRKPSLYPEKEFNHLWKVVLLNQFHDILPGSSIERVYDEANKAFEEMNKETVRLTETACSRLVQKDRKTITVFNSLSWDRNAIVELPEGWESAKLSDNTPLQIQKFKNKTVAQVPVPSCGWRSVVRCKEAAESSRMVITKNRLENGLLKIKINDKGEIVSIYDKVIQKELAKSVCNRFRLYKDLPTYFDAWDLEKNYQLNPVELDSKASVKIISKGPLVGIVGIKKSLNNSVLSQDIVIHQNSRLIEFRTTIDWREKHKVLKVNFPVQVHSDHALHEIQFGHLSRANHESRQYEENQFEVCNQKWTALTEEGRGVALLNDCKYGIDVQGSSMNLTLLRSPLGPDMHADQGTHEFTYALYPWNGTFFSSDCIQKAYELNCPVTVSRGNAETKSLFSVDTSNIIIEAVKMAEDSSGNVIVRLYDSKKSATKAFLKTSLPVSNAVETNMLEDTVLKKVPILKSGIKLEFRPFEIKTVRLIIKN